jgi:hypothetical protein
VVMVQTVRAEAEEATPPGRCGSRKMLHASLTRLTHTSSLLSPGDASPPRASPLLRARAAGRLGVTVNTTVSSTSSSSASYSTSSTLSRSSEPAPAELSPGLHRPDHLVLHFDINKTLVMVRGP